MSRDSTRLASQPPPTRGPVMRRSPASPFASIALASLLALVASASSARIVRAQQDPANAKPGRNPAQAIDEAYTKKIKEYTTEPFFLSPLVDYMPAAKGVPTPTAVLGDIAGNPHSLPHSKEVYEYMRLLAKSTPRVRVFSIGTTEEGREMIAVAVASDQLMARLDANKANLAKLADPRAIGMNDAEADRIALTAAPVYYITGTIHSTESGAPTALMELAYRLAVDESPYVRNIRDHVITLITPIVEVDGRDREADLVNYHLKHPNEVVPSLIYWGHYVAHDNNRDAMGATLKLTQNVLNTYVDWKAQVLHDLHESGSFLYDNTVGDGPYNAWLDPLVTNEWQLVAGLSHVHRRDAQRHQPVVRDVRQWRHTGSGRADALAKRDRAHVVSTESTVVACEMGPARQQQLRADRNPGVARVRGE